MNKREIYELEFNNKINEINNLNENEFAYIQTLDDDCELSFYVEDCNLYVEFIYESCCVSVADIICERGKLTREILKRYDDTIYNTLDTYLKYKRN